MRRVCAPSTSPVKVYPLLHGTASPPSRAHTVRLGSLTVKANVAVEELSGSGGPEVTETSGGGGLKYGSAPMAENEASAESEVSTHHSQEWAGGPFS